VKWLIDANVVLDVLTDRQPWADHSAEVLARVERGEATGYLAAHTVTTLHYLLSTHRSSERARKHTRVLLRLFEIVAVDEDRLLQALDLDLPDFEDAVQAACAERQGVDVLVTRNEADFAGLGLEVLSPVALLSRLDGDR
jgi:predicted nucleic acid-binding protein